MKTLGIKLYRWLEMHTPFHNCWRSRMADRIMDWLDAHGCEPPENKHLSGLVAKLCGEES